MQADTGGTMASEMPQFPPEVLQTIFHNLDFYDLLRCQQVCKTWRAYLPGNDRKLRHMLFVNYRRDEEEKGPEMSFEISLSTTVELVRYPKSFPSLLFSTRLNLNHEIGLFTSLNCYGDANHPILKSLEDNMHLISESLFTDETGGPTHYFQFKTVEEFYRMVQKIDNIKREEDGSWKDMLLCVPPLPVAYITFKYDPCEQREKTYKLCAKNEGGVTMGQFVEAFREELRSMEEHIDSHDFNVGLLYLMYQ